MNHLSDKVKERLGAAILIISIIVFGLIATPAGFLIAHAGKEMAELQSVSGESLAEHYYRLHGQIYHNIGILIAFVSIFICATGVAISSFLLKTQINALVRNNNLNQTDSSVASEGRPVADKCPNCNAELMEDSKFCIKCGAAINRQSVKQNACPSCGKQIADGSMFCTQCGTKLAK